MSDKPKRQFKLFSTEKLLDEVKANDGMWLEANMNLGYFNCTHWFKYHKGNIYHTGIDSATCRTSRKALMERYRDIVWGVEK